VSQTDQARYEFDDLPLSGIEPGQSVLVAGPVRLASRLARRLVLAGSDRGEGMVVVSTNDSARAALDACLADRPDLATDRLGVVDATGSANVNVDTDAHIASVSSSSDLTGISIQFSILYSALFEKDIRRIRACFDSISLLTMYTEFKTVTRFVHVMTGRVSATDGLGVFVVDPSMHDDQITHALTHLCDGRVDVRKADDGHELRIRGFPDQPEGWTSVDL